MKPESRPDLPGLLTLHRPRVEGVARRMLGRDDGAVADVTQQVMLDLAARAGELDCGGGLGAWLHRRTVFRVLSYQRAEARRAGREREVGERWRGAREAARSDDGWRASLDEALDSLPERDRALLIQRFYDDMSLAEVARALGCSEDAAQKRVARAVAKLRGRLGRSGVRISFSTLISAVRGEPPASAPWSRGDRFRWARWWPVGAAFAAIAAGWWLQTVGAASSASSAGTAARERERMRTRAADHPASAEPALPLAHRFTHAKTGDVWQAVIRDGATPLPLPPGAGTAARTVTFAVSARPDAVLSTVARALGWRIAPGGNWQPIAQPAPAEVRFGADGRPSLRVDTPVVSEEATRQAEALRAGPRHVHRFSGARVADVLRFLAEDAAIPYAMADDLDASLTESMVSLAVTGSSFATLEHVAGAAGVQVSFEAGVWMLSRAGVDLDGGECDVRPPTGRVEPESASAPLSLAVPFAFASAPDANWVLLCDRAAGADAVVMSGGLCRLEALHSALVAGGHQIFHRHGCWIVRAGEAGAVTRRYHLPQGGVRWRERLAGDGPADAALRFTSPDTCEVTAPRRAHDAFVRAVTRHWSN